MRKINLGLIILALCFALIVSPAPALGEDTFNFTQPTLLKQDASNNLDNSRLLEFEGYYYLLHKEENYYGGGLAGYFIDRYDSAWTLINSVELTISVSYGSFGFNCESDVYKFYPLSCDYVLDYVDGSFSVVCENYLKGINHFFVAYANSWFQVEKNLSISDYGDFAVYCSVLNPVKFQTPKVSNYGYGALAEWSFWTTAKRDTDDKIMRMEGTDETWINLDMPADMIQIFEWLPWQDLGDDSSSKAYMFYTANVNSGDWLGHRYLFVNTYTRETFAFESRTALITDDEVYYISIEKVGNIYNVLYQTTANRWKIAKFDSSFNLVNIETLNTLGVPYYRFSFDEITDTLFNKTFYVDFNNLTIHSIYDCTGTNSSVHLRMNITSLDSATTLNGLSLGTCDGADKDSWATHSVLDFAGENVYAEIYPDPPTGDNITNIDSAEARQFQFIKEPQLSKPTEELYITYSGRRHEDSLYGIWYVAEALPCFCSGWVAGGCVDLFRRYDRTCYPIDCDIEVNYTYDESCIEPDFYPAEIESQGESEWVSQGETAYCAPESILIPENAQNITSRLFAELRWESADSCTGTYEVLTCNPFGECETKPHGTPPNCSVADTQFDYYTKTYNDYIPGDIASGKAEAVVLDCTCRGNYKLICSLTINYIEPCSEKWICSDNTHKALLHDDCSIDNTTLCTYGCLNGECAAAPEVSPTTEYLQNWIEIAGEFLDDIFPDILMKSIFWIFLTIIAGGLIGWKSESWQLAALVIFALMLLGSFIAWLPWWVGVVFIILAGFAIAKMIVGGME